MDRASRLQASRDAAFTFTELMVVLAMLALCVVSLGLAGLSFSCVAGMVQGMSTKAEAVLDEFKSLPRAEQWSV